MLDDDSSTVRVIADVHYLLNPRTARLQSDAVCQN